MEHKIVVCFTIQASLGSWNTIWLSSIYKRRTSGTERSGNLPKWQTLAFKLQFVLSATLYTSWHSVWVSPVPTFTATKECTLSLGTSPASESGFHPLSGSPLPGAPPDKEDTSSRVYQSSLSHSAINILLGFTYFIAYPNERQFQNSLWGDETQNKLW